ncbi:radiation sensitive protein rad9 [Cladophialophora chaetospira]|uniref:Radiation sensitive protein rad9 n=1 Tax=Cladophialophora chaetospira TaxID=386627 RepID=A0AA39CPK1_9EURO|nr:radiation sensitive protein rad9 [Cladophialophora chaetospira]
MATESYLREDLDESLQRDLLEAKVYKNPGRRGQGHKTLIAQSSQIPHPFPDYELHHADHIAAATETEPQPVSAAPETQLPSTVPESQSQFQSNVETQLELISPAVRSEITPATRQKMASQVSDGATQELSPSHYDAILAQSRSALQLKNQEQEQDFHYGQDQDSESDVDADVTQHPGDSVYVDLMSSLNSENEDDENELDIAGGEESDQEVELAGDVQEQEQAEVANEGLGEQEHTQPDSEPIHFSPSQSQAALSQYPESQRFKTPGTAGRKRRYNGDIIDSPELPRNSKPSLRGHDNNGLSMGLTQAFGATQDNTSPFIGPTDGNLYSDRPSPSINLQPRPMTATSSPMKLMSTGTRSTRARTEPLDNYVSSKESQAQREARQKEKEKAIENYDPEEDAYEISEDSYMVKDRRIREREHRIRAQLPSSSPPAPATGGLPMSNSSPVHRATRSSPINPGKRRKISVKSSPPQPSQESQVTESEEETEQEDNAGVEVTGSSQHLLLVDEEDKENFADRAIQIPETTVRPQRILNYSATQVQESPLIRHGREANGEIPSTAVFSSQHFAIADSQPERSMRRLRAVNHASKSSADEGLDFVPQSPEASPRPTAPIVREVAPALMCAPRIVEDHTGSAADLPASSIEVRRQPDSTIPETSSSEVRVQSGNEPGDKAQPSESGSRGEFDTAQTHLQPSASNAQPAAVELSSPPILTAPPGKRRKLLQQQIEETTPDPSPAKSQSSFNASPALRLDANFASPSHESPRFVRPVEKPQKDNINEMEMPNAVSTEVQEGPEESAEHQGSNISRPVQHSAGMEAEAEPDVVEEQVVQPIQPRSTYPRRDRKPTAKGLSARNVKARSTAPPFPARASQFDLPESPQKKMVPAIKPPMALKRKAEDVTEPSDESPAGSSKRRKAGKTATVPITAPLDIKKTGPISPVTAANEPELPQPEALEDSRPSTGSPDIVAPNMVFAVFNGNSRTYHPALCLGHADVNPKRFKIQWEGYDPDIVDEYGVRRLDLRVGDQVKVDMPGFPKVSHVIRGFKDRVESAEVNHAVTDIRGFQTLVVAPKQRKSLPAEISTEAVKKIPISTIYLDSIMWGQMKDRLYEYKPSLDTPVSSARSTPGPQTSSSPPRTPPLRSRRGTAGIIPPSSSAIDLTEGIFSDMAFAVSYDDDIKRRDLVELIRDTGGIVLKESFLDLFQPNSMQLKEQFSELTFTALVTDRHTRKPKYLQALALGLPCLSGRWIEASVQAAQVLDWTSYLLAAGESLELDGATRSRILPPFSVTQRLKVSDIIALRASFFTGAKVLAVKGKGKYITEENFQHYVALIRALGPRQIDLEPDLHSAKEAIESAADTEESVEYVFVPDQVVEAARELLLSTDPAEWKNEPKAKGRGRPKKARSTDETESDTKSDIGDSRKAKVKIICNEDIVQSLILGRLWMGSS